MTNLPSGDVVWEALAADDDDQVVVHAFPTRPGRTIAFDVHSHRERRFFGVSLHRDGTPLRISAAVCQFAEFRRGVELIALQLAREGLL